ncbi:hypothetical protein FJV41_33835 [Myxococcus llanfairpwllgwyngyllgogerychwyrndrobwllllantysiliogogogochensis]|uniref:SbsA Ig-like domain-containing protein n=1 Tax=Myxococcus llanfairpwllgwyngyllgogerychwyrndrobwllllantysiliogogogochensis TaxID=2590453 RepID=A0A540WRI2_9BACT|nr:Ig-like domain-containing protein [Myxococcus llanfairpwllgwyngyllgogerychwyrndrobwllllantysiliogogogochensis]TQF11517.1 hypothetical protein FJV41_33835 [Myxococcus llanfairpwllgwyngyllgogerychwyrndrobwllllantysiliogogogochensis]
MHPFPQRAVIVCLGLLMGACIDVPEIQQVVEEPDGGPDTSPDASTPDAGEPSVLVRLVLSRHVTNGPVDVRAELSGPTPERVELLVNGRSVETLLPPYEMWWDTQALEERQHDLRVRATLGARVFLSEPQQLMVDRSPPIALSTSPGSGARFVPVGQEAQAVFSEPLDPATVHVNSIRMFADAEAVESEISLSGDGTIVTARSTSKWPVDALMKVSLGAGVTDLAGNPLRTMEQEWSWTVPGFIPLGEPLFPDSGNHTIPSDIDMRVDGLGRPVVAWHDGERNAVFVRRWTGASWELLGSGLNSGTADANPSQSSLQLDANGQPVVAWVEQMESTVHVRRWNGTGWVAMGEAIQSPLLLWNLFLRTDGAGQWFLGGPASNVGGSQVWVWKWVDDHWTQLGTALKVNASMAISGMQMDVDAAGNPVVFWSERDSAFIDTVYVRRWSAGDWRPVPFPFQDFGTTTGVDAAGRILIVNSLGHEDSQVWGVSGETWAEVGTPIEGRFPAAGTQVSVRGFTLDSTGVLVALLREAEAPGQPETFYVRRLRAGAWESISGLFRPLPDVPVGRPPVFGMAPSGRLFIARTEYTAPKIQPLRVYISNE